MKTKLILLLLILSFISCKDEISVITSKQPGKLAGTVQPKEAESIVDLIQGEIVAKDTTFNGIFEFSDVEPGVYRISVKADSFGTKKLNNIQVVDGEGTDVGIIQLSKYPYPLHYISPFEGEENIEVYNQSLLFRFEEGIDPSSMKRGLKIEPNATLEEVYSSSSNDYFHYRADLKFGTEYKLSLDSTVTTIYGDPLEFPFSTSFLTENFELKDVDYPDYYYGSSRSLNLYFNGEVTEAVENFITIEPSIPVSIITKSSRSYPQNRIYITPVNGWRADQKFDITVSKFLEEVNGATLGKDTTISFTSEELKIVKTYPMDGEHFIDTNYVIRIEPNYFLDQSTIKNSISITPSTDFSISTQIRYTETFFYILPNEALAPDTEYTVTIKSSLSDFYGVQMREDYSFTFKTEE